MAKGALLHDAGAITVTVPMTFRKRGGRKLVIAPNGADAWALPRARIDNTMVKALARAHRWKKQLDSGRFQTVQDLAEAEKINPSYIARVLRLGADMAGQAAAGLGAADHSTDAGISHCSAIIWQLRVACFCTGSADIAALAQARLLPPL